MQIKNIIKIMKKEQRITAKRNKKINKINKKLKKQQKDAIKFFLFHNYLIIDAPRQTGKSQVLQEIIKLYPKEKIGIFTPTWSMYEYNYKKFKNCKYIETSEMNKGYPYFKSKFDLIIADEIIIEIFLNQSLPVEVKFACAFSKRNIHKTLQMTNKQINIYKKKDKIYHEQSFNEIGQYL